MRWGGAVLVAAIVLWLPTWLSPSDSLLASSVGIYGIVGLSLLVLTGWAGQVSLGQMGFVGLGAAIGGVATSQWGLDLSLALLVSGLAGAVAAVVVGLPALRLQGLLLSVTTFAFALAMYSYFLNRQFFDWIPTGRIERNPIFGRIDYDSPTGVYYLILVVLVLAILAVGGMRSSRFGRALIALRENERGPRPSPSAPCGCASPRSRSPASWPPWPGACSSTTSRPSGPTPTRPSAASSSSRWSSSVAWARRWASCSAPPTWS